MNEKRRRKKHGAKNTVQRIVGGRINQLDCRKARLTEFGLCERERDADWIKS